MENKDLVQLYMFSLPNCGPCKAVYPKAVDSCKELNIELVKVDVIEDMELYAQKVSAGEWPTVKQAPTFFIYTLGAFVRILNYGIVTSPIRLNEFITEIRLALLNPADDKVQEQFPPINLN